MTTVDAYGDDRGRFARAAIWWGHVSLPYEPYMYVTVWLFLFSQWWIPEGALPFAANVAVLTVGSVAIAVHLVTMFSQMLHDSRLCWLDVSASVILLDPQGEVDRNRKYLAGFHNRPRRRALLALGALPIVAMFVIPGDRPMSLRIAFTVAAAVGVAALIYTTHIQQVHRRLHPWCPWCKRRGDDDDATTPAPTPVPAGTRDA